MDLTRNEYVEAIRSLLGGNPQDIKEANRKLYQACLPGRSEEKIPIPPTTTEADLALAEAGAR